MPNVVVGKVEVRKAKIKVLFVQAYPSFEYRYLKQLLEQYVPGGLSAAVVTALGEDNSAEIVISNGERTAIPWAGISWAKPYVDPETTGPAPTSCWSFRPQILLRPRSS